MVVGTLPNTLDAVCLSLNGTHARVFWSTHCIAQCLRSTGLALLSISLLPDKTQTLHKPTSNPAQLFRSVYHIGGVGQAIAATLALWRKVRALQGKVPGNAWGARAYGKCSREQTA